MTLEALEILLSEEGEQVDTRFVRRLLKLRIKKVEMIGRKELKTII